MSRRIVTREFQASGDANKLDDFFTRVIKYVPADVVAGWLLVSSLVSGQGNVPDVLPWVIFAVGVVLAALWQWKQTSEPNLPPAKTQIALAAVAFAVWAFALGWPFNTLSWFQPLWGSLLLVLFTFVSGLVTPAD